MSRVNHRIFLAGTLSIVFFFSFFQSSQAGFFDWFRKNDSQSSQSSQSVAAVASSSKQHTLSVSKSGLGTVTSDDGKINCGKQCKASYPANSKIVLRAEAGNNYKFDRWNGCDKVSDGKCQTTLNKSKMIVAKFASKIAKSSSSSQKSSSSSVGKASSSKSSRASSKASSSKAFSSSSSSKSSNSVSNQQAQSSNTPSSSIHITPITKNGFLLSGSLCTFDFSLVPQSEVNARRLLGLCEVDVPILEAKFGRGPSAPLYKIQFYTPIGNGTIAYAVTSGVVFLSTKPWNSESTGSSWHIESPYDAKILAHEITHVIQSFKSYNSEDSGWLVEALADYGAYVAGYSNDLEKDCYHFSTDMQNQTHVYSCTYKFLKFVESKYDSEIPVKLHRALQSGTYSDNLWTQYTGKTFNQLTSECTQDSNCRGLYHGGL